MACIPRCMGQRPTFISMMVLTTSFFFVEIIVGYMTNSMALVADSFHMLSDIISLFVGFFAMRYSRITKGNVFNANTFGWARAEVLGALVNAVFLVALCFSILVEALKRLVEPERLKDPNLILVVGAVGLLVNLIGMFLFHGHAGHGHSHGGGGGHGHSHGGGRDSHGHSHGHEEHEEDEEVVDAIVKGKDGGTKAIDVGLHNMSFDNGENITPLSREKNMVNGGSEYVIAVINDSDEATTTTTTQHKKHKKAKSSGQMNMRGVYLHILGDALGSVIVIVAALIVKYCDGKWTLYVDPALSIIMVAIILKTSLPLLKESSTILLQHVPSHIELQKLQSRLLGTFPQIVSVHEFHVWQLTGSRIVASLHVMFTSTKDYDSISPSLKKFFHKEGIHSTTVQPEFIDEVDDFYIDEEKQCLLACVDEACAEKVCCKPKKTKSQPGSNNSRSSSPTDRAASDLPQSGRTLDNGHVANISCSEENSGKDFVEVDLETKEDTNKQIDNDQVEIQIESEVKEEEENTKNSRL